MPFVDKKGAMKLLKKLKMVNVPVNAELFGCVILNML